MLRFQTSLAANPILLTPFVRMQNARNAMHPHALPTHFENSSHVVKRLACSVLIYNISSPDSWK